MVFQVKNDANWIHLVEFSVSYKTQFISNEIVRVNTVERGVLKQFLRRKKTDAHSKMNFCVTTHTFHSLDLHFYFIGT